MKTPKMLWKENWRTYTKGHLKKWWMAYVLSAAYVSKIAIPATLNVCFTRDLDDGICLFELGNTKRFYDEKTAHFYFSYGNRGNLDKVAKLTPIPPMGGGPGWAACEIPASEEDMQRFEKAKTLAQKLNQ